MYFAKFYVNVNGTIRERLGSDGYARIDGRLTIENQQKQALTKAKELVHFGIPIVGFELIRSTNSKETVYSSCVPFSAYDQNGLIL